MENSIFIETKLIDTIFSIFKDPTRRKILAMLLEINRTADEITDNLEISRPAVEKHLKMMLDIGFIERKAETYPTMKYFYSIPEPTKELISNIYDVIETFISSMRDEYTRRLEQEEQKLVLGMSNKERYTAVKNAYMKILRKYDFD